MDKFGFVLKGLMTSYFACIVTSVVLPSYRKSTIASEKAHPSYKNSIHTRFYTRTENQEAQQATVSAVEFKDMRSDLRNLVHMMSITMSRPENQTPPPTV